VAIGEGEDSVNIERRQGKSEVRGRRDIRDHDSTVHCYIRPSVI
jgi:hypothetical protein